MGSSRIHYQLQRLCHRSDGKGTAVHLIHPCARQDPIKMKKKTIVSSGSDEIDVDTLELYLDDNSSDGFVNAEVSS